MWNSEKFMLKKYKNQKNGYSACSFFRQGIDVLRRGLKNVKPDFVTLCKEYIGKMIQWFGVQVSYNQTITENLRVQ